MKHGHFHTLKFGVLGQMFYRCFQETKNGFVFALEKHGFVVIAKTCENTTVTLNKVRLDGPFFCNYEHVQLFRLSVKGETRNQNMKAFPMLNAMKRFWLLWLQLLPCALA